MQVGLEAISLLFAITGFLTFVGVAVYVALKIGDARKKEAIAFDQFLEKKTQEQKEFILEMRKMQDGWESRLSEYNSAAFQHFENVVRGREKTADQIFEDIKEKFAVRDRELEVVLTDIPKRVNEAILVAQARFSEPYKQMQADLDKNGLAPAGDHDPVEIDFDMEARLERALQEFDLQTKQKAPALDER